MSLKCNRELSLKLSHAKKYEISRFYVGGNGQQNITDLYNLNLRIHWYIRFSSITER